MPTYEYQREDGTTFEALQRISDPPLETCPETGQRVRRILSGGAGLIFKGSGFYLTDYARKNGASNGNGAQPKEEKSSDGAATTSNTPTADSSGKASE